MGRDDEGNLSIRRSLDFVWCACFRAVGLWRHGSMGDQPSGMVCWVALIVGATGAGARVVWRRSRQLLPRYRTITGIAVIALAGVLIHAVVDFPLQIASIQLYAAVCLGICERKYGDEACEPRARYEKWTHVS